MLFKPPVLIIKRKEDPEQLSKDWKEYVDKFKLFLKVTKVAGVHVKPEVAGTPCVACKNSKNLLRIRGGSEITNLFNNIGKVTVTDSWEESLDKVSREISEQINQADDQNSATQRSGN